MAMELKNKFNSHILEMETEAKLNNTYRGHVEQHFKLGLNMVSCLYFAMFIRSAHPLVGV